MTKIAALLLASAGAWAQPAIAPPSLGFVEDSARSLRPAYGLAGNFILGPSVAGKIVSEAFSGSIGLLKTDSSLAALPIPPLAAPPERDPRLSLAPAPPP